ncbi:hypothetical protein HN789_03405 [archaeon]|jgi:preprotein translocase subunit SecF|nr:hypothetical protein [archaeon]MBT4022647.1 hypothetical protein [archaeon]MBT4272087.1 hypothetical protein [archaeon]MBT4461184.1 hypothetical protein [archaeon]MBT4858708.1 hypothetical protein [archaeon]
MKKTRGFLDNLKEYYYKEYKKLFWIPVILFLLSALVIFNTARTTGDFINRDVSLKGGISITIETGYSDINNLENTLNLAFPTSSINLRTVESSGVITGIIIEASDISQNDLLAEITKLIPLTKENYNVETMGSTLGQSFFKQMFVALLIAFVSMGIVFQLYFKNIYGTAAALFSAFMDIFITVGITNLMGIKLTAGGIAAYLMLIGYSIDTSILLSTKLLKEKGDLKQGLFNAMTTGFTMSAAGIAAMGVSFLLTNNSTLRQIMLILVIGLVIDLITTWVGNVAFLRYYLERRK